MKADELIALIQEMDNKCKEKNEMDFCIMGKAGHGEPAFPEPVKKIGVEIDPFTRKFVFIIHS